MASYKKYAEDLIGNWETGQYEPQRNVTQQVYQTNINKLANDFGTLKDKLARNFENAQLEYANTMNAVQNQSFNRMRNANIDLANRGLTTSGVGNLVTQADVQQKGEDVDKALGDLLAVNNASIEGLTSGVMNLGQKQSALAGDLAGDLGGLTDKEAENLQQYRSLVAGIGNSAANRAASRARSGGGSSKKSKEEKEYDEIKRKILIGDTLESTELTDDQKKNYLVQYLDVKPDVARAAVDGYNTNMKLQAGNKKINRLENNIAGYDSYLNTRPIGKMNTGGNFTIGDMLRNYYETMINPVNTARDVTTNALRYYDDRNLQKARNDIAGLTYTDLNELLYGRK